MAHVSHRLRTAFQGALAGGGDPATSPLYVFGPFLKLVVVAGVANITFGASIWMVVFTVAMVSAMYRLVMRWVVDGSGGSGLSEEEFGPWAVKVNAGITFVEYTLTFLVSIAALVTFVADRVPALAGGALGVPYRTVLAVVISIGIGWLVNRGPRTAARAFGPATLAVLLLLWTMIVATIWKRGLHLPGFDLRAFHPEYFHFTLGGFARILALMTGIEIFANLVAAYEGTSAERSRKAFGSLLIIMGTTCLTMLVVGPAILAEADPTLAVSVFTQTMDHLLPAPLPLVGTLIGVLVLASAAAASAQGLQNLALGLRYRHYIPAWLGLRNRFDVAAMPVWVEVAVVTACFAAFGTHEETYLAIYAAGVFILLSMTGWAAAKRLLRQLRARFDAATMATLAGTVVAALLTTAATAIIFEERFFEGAWTYLLFLPALYIAFTWFRARLGPPLPLDEHLGRFFVGQYLLPYQRHAHDREAVGLERILVPLDGTTFAEQALPIAEVLAHAAHGQLDLVSVSADEEGDRAAPESGPGDAATASAYLEQQAWALRRGGVTVGTAVERGAVAEAIVRRAGAVGADVIAMATHARSGVERMLAGSVATGVVRRSTVPVLLVRPDEAWTTRSSRFQRLLVTLDGSEGAEAVLPYVRAIARQFGGTVKLLSVPETEAELPKLEHYLTSVGEALRSHGIAAESAVTGSGAARTILATATESGADLIVMATRGRGATPSRDDVGSVTEGVVRGTQCPVLAVPVGGVSAAAESARGA